MPLPRQIPAAAGAPSDEDLLTPEEAADQRRRRRWRWVLSLLALLAIAGWLGARPALHEIKAYQARRLAAEARRLIDAEKWPEARDKVTDALQIWPDEPAAIQAAALLLTRVGNFADAAGFWKKLEQSRPLTAPEQRDYATAELSLGELDVAQDRLRRAWPAEQAGTPNDWLVGLQLALRRNQPQDAQELARRLLSSRTISGRQRLNAATVLLSSNQAADQTFAWAEIRALADNTKTAESLEALQLLARRAAAEYANASAPEGGSAKDGDPRPALASLAEIRAKIAAHPLAGVQQRLLVYDLRMIEQPGQRAALLQAAMGQYANAAPADLAVLGAWLYAKGELARVLEVIPLQKALSDHALFLQYLDTLGALQRWGEIRDLIQSQKVALDPMLQQMYLARCAGQLGEPEASTLHWQSALAAAGTNVQKLLTVGRYAEKDDAGDIAESAFRAAVRTEPRSREGHVSLARLLEARGKTRALRDAVRAMALLWPQDHAVANDLAYFDGLLNENVKAARTVASALVAAEPASLPHRTTLALAELRLGDGLSALDAFRAVGALGAAAQPRSQAVYAAVLWQTSYEREARQAVKNIPLQRLLPEERALVQPIEESTVEEAKRS